MSLRYSDRQTAETNVPDCFGREAYYDSKCSECRRCEFENQCRNEIAEKKGYVVPVRRSEPSYSRPYSDPYRPQSYQPQGSRAPVGRTHAGVIQEGERPMTRFLKDLFTGAMRGAFQEGTEFFTYWRW